MLRTVTPPRSNLAEPKEEPREDGAYKLSEISLKRSGFSLPNGSDSEGISDRAKRRAKALMALSSDAESCEKPSHNVSDVDDFARYPKAER